MTRPKISLPAAFALEESYLTRSLGIEKQTDVAYLSDSRIDFS